MLFTHGGMGDRGVYLTKRKNARLFHGAEQCRAFLRNGQVMIAERTIIVIQKSLLLTLYPEYSNIFFNKLYFLLIQTSLYYVINSND